MLISKMSKKTKFQAEEMKKYWLIYLASQMPKTIKDQRIMVSQFLMMPYFDFNRIIKSVHYCNFLHYFQNKLNAFFNLPDDQIRDYYEDQMKQSVCILALKNKLGWDYVFDQMEVDIQVFLNRKGEKWSYFERWIFFLCTQVKKETRKESFAPTSIILKRTINGFNKSYEQLILSDFTFEFNKKYKSHKNRLLKLLSSEDEQLNKIYYKYERVLIFCIKKSYGWNFVQKQLNLQQFLKKGNLVQSETDQWINFLQTKINNQKCFANKENAQVFAKMQKKYIDILKMTHEDCKQAFTYDKQRILIFQIKNIQNQSKQLKSKKKKLNLSLQENNEQKSKEFISSQSELIRQKHLNKQIKKEEVNQSEQVLENQMIKHEQNLNLVDNQIQNKDFQLKFLKDTVFKEQIKDRNIWLIFLLNQSYTVFNKNNWREPIHPEFFELFDRNKELYTKIGYQRIYIIQQNVQLLETITSSLEKQMIIFLLENTHQRYTRGRRYKRINTQQLKQQIQSENSHQSNSSEKRKINNVIQDLDSENNEESFEEIILESQSFYELPSKSNKDNQKRIVFKSEKHVDQEIFTEEEKFIIFLILLKKHNINSLLQAFISHSFEDISDLISKMPKVEKNCRWKQAKYYLQYFHKNDGQIESIKSSKAKYLIMKFISENHLKLKKRIELKSKVEGQISNKDKDKDNDEESIEQCEDDYRIDKEKVQINSTRDKSDEDDEFEGNCQADEVEEQEEDQYEVEGEGSYEAQEEGHYQEQGEQQDEVKIESEQKMLS